MLAMLGDSITFAGNWPLFLQRDDIANFGVNGDTTHDIYRRIDQVLEKGPAHCFVLAGINDLFMGRGPEKAFHDYQKILTSLQLAKINIHVQSTIITSEEPINHQVHELNQSLRAFCQEKEIDFIDINPIFERDGFISPEYTDDGVHLTPLAYQKWGSFLLDYTREHSI